jgi:hypothetical protein
LCHQEFRPTLTRLFLAPQVFVESLIDHLGSGLVVPDKRGKKKVLSGSQSTESIPESLERGPGGAGEFGGFGNSSLVKSELREIGIGDTYLFRLAEVLKHALSQLKFVGGRFDRAASEVEHREVGAKTSLGSFLPRRCRELDDSVDFRLGFGRATEVHKNSGPGPAAPNRQLDRKSVAIECEVGFSEPGEAGL